MFFQRFASVVLAISCLTAVSCKKPQGLEFRGFNNFSINPISFSQSRVSLGISVFNPNNFDIKVSHVDADIQLAGANIGNYILDSSFLLKANAPFTMPVSLTIKNSLLLGNAINLFSSDSVAYSLTGHVRAGRKIATAEIPFTYSGRLTQSDFNLR